MPLDGTAFVAPASQSVEANDFERWRLSSTDLTIYFDSATPASSWLPTAHRCVWLNTVNQKSIPKYGRGRIEGSPTAPLKWNGFWPRLSHRPLAIDYLWRITEIVGFTTFDIAILAFNVKSLSNSNRNHGHPLPVSNLPRQSIRRQPKAHSCRTLGSDAN